MSLNGKVALVTGASRGIGAAIALQLGADGATVVGTATSESGAENISKMLAEAGVSGKGMMLNVTNPESIAQVIDTISKEYGAPTVLVNNAGITKDNLLMRMGDDQWLDVIETNLNSVYRVTKAVLRGMMKAKWGRVINIASVVGSMGNPGQTNYAATKAGVAGFARSLAKEVGSRGITINTVAPGFIDTDMTRALSDDQRALMLSAVPLGRLGEAQEIADVVAFLAGDKGAYITGETIHVNGGMYMN
ncbi:3-oxoacyl-ACP reductase FabG [Halioxenophilus sp. WMMB6]|uniref:3-oxoacyl-ACP reductase FabG n=1 Tax=Halioxenophilus sp. WMMB6 TaxID=3073815 RepID=UPI00295F449B|nr:3-oxoacyl-ACP reductase FabG [Halioxenophilus sp. WMMB6]